MSPATIILVVAVLGGLYMAWTIGANDVANAMGTSVGSGALTLVGAIVVAGALEFAGAVLVGSHVTETISKGIIDISLFDPAGALGEDGPLILALGMLSALFGAALWLHLATHLGLPVSTTHSIVGAVIGIGIVSFGLGGVRWGALGGIVGSWLVSPLLGGLLSFFSFFVIRRLILRNDDPVAATKRIAPYLVGIVVAVMVLSFIYKVLSNRTTVPPALLALVLAAMAGTIAGAMVRLLVRRSGPANGASPYDYVERIFAYLQIATACFVAFAHGANDVANAIGPLASVVSLYQSGFTAVASKVGVPLWVLVLGGAGIVLGVATYGYKVIATIGREITEITPTRGFCAEFGAATTVLIASSLGLPISTTHTLVGGVIGIGFAQGIGALNMAMVRSIVNSWVATVPVAAAVSALIFIVARALVL
jgi:PiT family inorganic phosphate transporter